jgi:fibronectin-binding autotransporter adhesin
MFRLSLHIRIQIFLAFIAGAAVIAQAQTTSWKGTTSTAWGTASNWTNGVPTASLDAILGDANFTGANQPSITATATAKSLTIGGGAKATTLTMSQTTTIASNVTINSNGTLNHTATRTTRTLTVRGNWTNSGTYTATSSTNTTVIFGGTAQTIGGTNSTTFRRLTINAGSAVTLNQNITVNVAVVQNHEQRNDGF